MLSPPYYSHDFFIYVVASQETVGMVLVQEDEDLHEHVIYYLSRNLNDAQLRYSHVDKLALATIHAVQRLRHYIHLCQKTFIAHVNPFQFILTRRMIGGKYNKWIVILQEFDLEFAELISYFLSLDEGEVHEDSFIDEYIFLISNADPWYWDIIV